MDINHIFTDSFNVGTCVLCYFLLHNISPHNLSKKRENIKMNLCVPVIGNHEIHEH